MLHRRLGFLTILASRLLLAVVLLGSVAACSTMSKFNPFSSKDSSKDTSDTDADTSEDVSKMPVELLYNRGVDAMNEKRYTVAAKQFDLVEQNYPYASWAVNAQLMEGYSQYLQQHYTDAIGTLDRFIQLHPSHRDIAYAYYLRALSFYEQISDIKRDQKATQDAIVALRDVVNRFPDSAYAKDAALKIDLCRDHLAGKEMEIGRWYENQHLYTAAIGRFQRVVDDYQTTNHVAEALHRLTEIYLKLGLTDEARKTAAVLGHNYPGSPWYEDSYDQLVSVGEVTDQRDGRTTASGQPVERPGFFSRLWHSVF
jgi:outer membrane protein assembly factor BamD